MELSIIITSYKNQELLKVCLDSIKKNLTLPSSDWETIVADSETEEKTELMMREDFPEITFIPSKENIGFGRTVRNGFEKSCGQYILILNGDIIVKKDAIEKLLEFVKGNPNIGIAGPQLLNFNETLQYSCFKFLTPLTVIYRRTFIGRFKFAKARLDKFLMKDFDHKNIKEVDWVMGSAMMTRRKTINEVGLLDDRFKMYLEDTDWCRQFWEKGYRVIYYPEAQMYHYHGKGSDSRRGVLKTLLSNQLAWWHIRSAVKYFMKYAGKPTPRHN